MTAPLTGTLPPVPVETLSSGEVTLRFARIVPGEPGQGIVPYFHFRILAPNGQDVGHINFRVGDTEHVRISVGHLGYGIARPFRGRHYALQACHAIAPFVRSVYRAVILTCDPDNLASRRTIECLGARFIDEVALPPRDPQYQLGSEFKRRYEWTP